MDSKVFKVILEADNNEFVAGIAILNALAIQMQSRVGYYEHDEDSSNIRKVGEWVYKIQRLDEDMLGLLKAGAESEGKVEDMFRAGQNLSEDSWEMTWEEYFAFNTVVNRKVCRKLYTFCLEAVTKEQQSGGTNILISAATASNVTINNY